MEGEREEGRGLPKSIITTIECCAHWAGYDNEEGGLV